MTRLAFLFALTAAATAALASDDALIRHQYDEQAAAINTANAKRLFATMSPTFTEVDEKGDHINFRQYTQNMGMLFSQLKAGSVTYKLGPISYSHGLASFDYSWKGDLFAKAGPGKVHIVEKGHDTWKKVGNKYLQVHEVVTLSKQTVVKQDPKIS